MKKDKGVAVANSMSPNNSGEDTEKDSLLPTIRFSSRNASSKYDFVKVPSFSLCLVPQKMFWNY